MIKLIVAIGKNDVIGNGNKLPWHSSEELKHFKNMTDGKSVVMGRNTVLSLPVELKNRYVYVLSDVPGEKLKNADEVINSFDHIITKFRDSDEDCFIAGGKQVYMAFYKEAEELYITKMHKNYVGDVLLKLDLSEYDESVFKEGSEFTVYKYIRRRKNGN